MQKRPIKATTRWQVWVATEVFSIATEVSGSVERQWVLCHDRIWSWQGVPRSRPWLLSVVTMSRQRFPCRDRDNHNERSKLRRSLVKAKRFHVAIENCIVVTGFHGVMSRQVILCHDREWPRSKDLGCDRVNSIATE